MNKHLELNLYEWFIDFAILLDMGIVSAENAKTTISMSGRGES
jgi:hypothetical protein